MDIEKVRNLLMRTILAEPEAIFKMCDAWWTYQGLPNEPHALLTSGLHSDGYINVNTVTQFPNIRNYLASEIVIELVKRRIEDIDAIISSSSAGISIGQAVSDRLRAISVFTEKEGDDQVWTGRFELPVGARLLQVEDLITTLGTTKQVKEAVLKKNPGVEFVEEDEKTVVATIVHRPSKLPIEYPDYKVIPVIELEIHNWQPGECPLCKQGSEALKPKPNWQRFIYPNRMG